MNEITKMHNDLIDLPLRKFNASEIDILTALCYKCQEHKSEEIKLKFSQIKELSFYKGKDDKQFLNDLLNTNKKLMELNFTIRNEERHETTQFVLFPTFTTNENEGILRVKVNEEFVYLLNNLQNCYTSLELQESSSLKSSYSKGIYKKLRQFRSTGKWVVKLEDFREYLDIPKSFKQSHIDKRVIEPALAELSAFFEDLDCSKNYAKKAGRGRPKVIGYEWNFQKEQKEKKSLSVEHIAETGGWKKTSFCCPVCKEVMYEKRLTNEFGEYSLFGHPDFKTGKCKQVYYDRGELIPASKIEAEKEIEEDSRFTKEERDKNKNILSKMISELFK